jgi:hypothetical protein
MHHAALPFSQRVDPLDGWLKAHQTIGDEQQHPLQAPMPQALQHLAFSLGKRQ